MKNIFEVLNELESTYLSSKKLAEEKIEQLDEEIKGLELSLESVNEQIKKFKKEGINIEEIEHEEKSTQEKINGDEEELNIEEDEHTRKIKMAKEALENREGLQKSKEEKEAYKISLQERVKANGPKFVKGYRAKIKEEISSREELMAQIKAEEEKLVKQRDDDIKQRTHNVKKSKNKEKCRSYKQLSNKIEKENEKIHELITSYKKVLKEISDFKMRLKKMDEKYEYLETGRKLEEKTKKAKTSARKDREKQERKSKEPKQTAEAKKDKQPKVSKIRENQRKQQEAAWGIKSQDIVKNYKVDVNGEIVKPSKEPDKKLNQEEIDVIVENTEEITNQELKMDDKVSIKYDAATNTYSVENIGKEEIKKFRLKNQDIAIEAIAKAYGKNVSYLIYVNKVVLALLRDYDRTYNTNKASQYVDKVSAMGKNKEQRKQDMEDISVKIEYNLNGLYANKEISKQERQMLLKQANIEKRQGISNVTRDFKSRFEGFIGKIKESRFNIFRNINSPKLTDGKNTNAKDKVQKAIEGIKKDAKNFREGIGSKNIDENRAKKVADQKASEQHKENKEILI